ncbi:hypothetical protein CROQUDRAFT_92590 [Cronartium quercuum f. sp. fusiforme G11]|uniref:Uncharacterized protein n=1 Tax=Cronartium quercuum f. sp. fusiforme G11 TaxID=708437 RepID=A0A9P6TD94_9BASI|nr:hypothetical protein CROQUDRAFT_92590 [Cronartium quercuum f. sp. fusiforme G11]
MSSAPRKLLGDGPCAWPSQTFCSRLWRRVIASPSPLLRPPSTSLSTHRPQPPSPLPSHPSTSTPPFTNLPTHEPLSTSLHNQTLMPATAQQILFTSPLHHFIFIHQNQVI